MAHRFSNSGVNLYKQAAGKRLSIGQEQPQQLQQQQVAVTGRNSRQQQKILETHISGANLYEQAAGKRQSTGQHEQQLDAQPEEQSSGWWQAYEMFGEQLNGNCKDGLLKRVAKHPLD